MKSFRLLFLLLLCVLLSSCAQKETLVEYDGRLLTKDELAALVSAAIETEAEPPIPVVRFGEGEVEEENRVYFTAGGSVWHTKPDCGHLSKKNTIYYGTREEAASLGKDRGCSSCNKEEN